MINLFLKFKKSIVGVLLFAVVFSFTASAFFVAPPKPKEGTAVVGCILMLINALGGNIAALASFFNVAVTDNGNELKEKCLDGLLYIAVDVVLTKVVQSIVDWINSGFDGGPGFITNPQNFARNIVDDYVGAFIQSSPVINLLCSPHALHVKLYLFSRRSIGEGKKCTLSDVVRNMEDFISGAESGGWRAWFELTQRSQNNIFGAQIVAEGDLDVFTERALERLNRELSWGQGFFSVKDPQCKAQVKQYQQTGSFVGVTPQITVANCPNVSPGNAIASYANFGIQFPMSKAALADEIDEGITAIVSALMNQALIRAEGLLSGKGKDLDYNNGRGISTQDILNDAINGLGRGGNGQSPITEADKRFPPTGILGDAVEFEAGGDFFVANEQNPFFEFVLNVPTGRYYREATIDYDVYIDKFNGGAFNGSLVTLRRYFVVWVNRNREAERGRRTVIDSYDESVGIKRDWTENTNYHIKAVYSAEAGDVKFFVTNKDTGAVMNVVSGKAINRNITNKDGTRKNDLRVQFGTPGILDDGGYYPPFGWRFSNLKVQLR